MKASIHALTALLLVVAIAGCALIPVQERTFKNDQGSTITCKQTGTGLISGPVAKSSYDACVKNANAQGYK